MKALELVGVQRRDDVRSALRACLAQRREQHELFDQAFDAFFATTLRADATPSLEGAATPKADAAAANTIAPRLASALLREGYGANAPNPRIIERTVHLASFSADEALREKDFDKMTASELDAVQHSLRTFELPRSRLAARRWHAAALGQRLNWRHTLRHALRTGGEVIKLTRATRDVQHPPLVAICDISGSMDRYTRVFLHFLHALAERGSRLHVFLFGTRLTNVSRQLRHRDVDIALGEIAKRVSDWTGGTRIGACLHDFNQHWSRRVLGQNAIVLLMTDGLDRGDINLLSSEVAHLKRAAHQIFWLNPLLRYEQFEAKAAGVRALAQHLRMQPIHNLQSVGQIAAALAKGH